MSGVGRHPMKGGRPAAIKRQKRAQDAKDAQYIRDAERVQREMRDKVRRRMSTGDRGDQDG